jgi:hypothetical protein
MYVHIPMCMYVHVINAAQADQVSHHPPLSHSTQPDLSWSGLEWMDGVDIHKSHDMTQTPSTPS